MQTRTQSATHRPYPIPGDYMSGVAAILQPLRRLDELEKIVTRDLSTYVEVGWALLEIQRSRLYFDAGYRTFEEYCHDRLGYGRQYAYKLIQAAKVAAVLSPIGDTGPANEGQARELAPLLDVPDALV